MSPYVIRHPTPSPLPGFIPNYSPRAYTIQSHAGLPDIPCNGTHAPTSRPLHVLYPLLRTPLPLYLHGLFYTSLRSLYICAATGENFPTHHISKAPSDSASPPHYYYHSFSLLPTSLSFAALATPETCILIYTLFSASFTSM